MAENENIAYMNKIYWIWLTAVCGMYSSKIEIILNHFNTPEEVYSAEEAELSEVVGLAKSDIKRLCNKSLSGAKKIMRDMVNLGVDIVTFDDEYYPPNLKHIHNPPYILYMKGLRVDWNKIAGITVIGTRKNTSYGASVTSYMSRELTKAGLTVISGMANGIDGIAARAAIDAGGITIAVLGSGIDVIYPKQNEDLYRAIVNRGVVMTEYPPGTPPLGKHFPQRNRIMSGLGEGVLVVEAPEKSGALITANQALDMGKSVFAVPGPILGENSIGTNNLIKEGAIVATTPIDVLYDYERFTLHPLSEIDAVEYYSIKYREKIKLPDTDDSDDEIQNTSDVGEKKKASSEKSEQKKEKPKAELDVSGLDDNEKNIVSLLKEQDYAFDELVRKTQISAKELNNILFTLEIKGIVLKQAGNFYKINI